MFEFWKQEVVEKSGQTESDIEAEARSRQIEASLSTRTGVKGQTKAGVGPARNKRAMGRTSGR